MIPLLIISIALMGIFLTVFTVFAFKGEVDFDEKKSFILYLVIWLSYAFIITTLGISLMKIMENNIMIKSCINFINQIGK